MGIILPQEVEVTLNSPAIKYYEDKGYILPKYYNERDKKYKVKSGTKIKVNVTDLPNHSEKRVKFICDYCYKVFDKSYHNFMAEKDKTRCSCKNCQKIKQNEIMYEKYGVISPFSIKSVKDKSKNTMIERYGEDNALKVKQFKEKQEQTNMERYGVKHPIQNEAIFKKIKQTNLIKYGFENPILNKDVIEKRDQTNLIRYGTSNILSDPEIRKKMAESFYLCNSQNVSKQQLYLHSLYGGELNYPCESYNLDIALLEDMIDVEYDGGGHKLSYIMGHYTDKELERKAIIRSNIVKRNGYKTMRIISDKDNLPSDEVLLQILEDTKQYFKTTTHTWREYYIDDSLMKDAEHMEGVFFNYGNTRKIKTQKII